MPAPGAGLGEGNACRVVGFAGFVCGGVAGVAAQASIVAVAPGVEVAVVAYGHGVASSGAGLGEGDACRGIGFAGVVVLLVAGGAAAELSVGVVAPGVHVALTVQSSRVAPACTGTDESDVCWDLYLAGHGVGCAGGVSAQSTGAVVSPAVNVAVGAYGHCI